MLLGAAGGALPDVDVFWGFLADPALPWEYHRHFTHALAFIPIGGAIAAAPFLLWKVFRKNAIATWAAATAGCAVHGVNDTLTSFGTFLYWPFSTERVAWDVISIIDPLLTLPLIAGLIIAAALGKSWPTRAALTLALAYISLGVVQNQRVLAVQRELAAVRGHELQRGRAMPTFGNIIIWRSLYEDELGMLHADAVRPGLFGPTRVREGESLKRVEIEALRADPRITARLDRVLLGFEQFADGYIGLVGDNPNALGDMRYSMITEGFSPMWGLKLNLLDSVDQVYWGHYRMSGGSTRGDAIRSLWQDIAQPDEQWIALESLPR